MTNKHASKQPVTDRERLISHFAFDACQRRLLDSIPITGQMLAKRSMHWISDFGASFPGGRWPLGWQRHSALFRWIEVQYSDLLTTKIRCELLASIAGCWAIEQFTDIGWSRIVVLDQDTGMAVGAIRPNCFGDTTRVFRLGNVDHHPVTHGGTSSLVYSIGNTWSVVKYHQL